MRMIRAPGVYLAHLLCAGDSSTSVTLFEPHSNSVKWWQFHPYCKTAEKSNQITQSPSDVSGIGTQDHLTTTTIHCFFVSEVQRQETHGV